ncbi:hypothetical protein HJC23_003541 [Cyclotella cryptica]|uniref:Domain of unknown function at the cortex 1 domain-containing protein n=1 Tax=Cyclotella cryptica TaxID=29204 RepID=A0ABD3NZ29_9STRA|eukprot:CCRYP_018597-RB/>CCRYP_018597-RB protein AED:0.25 eAED:0.25 QI:478/1/1/1/0.66/0.5/4/105/375
MILDLFRSTKRSHGTDASCERHPRKAIVEEDDRRAFLDYSLQSGLPPLTKWSNDVTTFVVPSQRANGIEYQHSSCDGKIIKSLPMNGDVVAFSGPSFEGKLVSRMRDVPLHPCNGKHMTNEEYFRNRSRQYQWTVQGRFKRRIRFDQIVTGQEFGRPFRNMPSLRMVKKGLDLLKHKLPETFECDLFSEQPKFEHPLLAGCQSFRIDRLDHIKDRHEIHGIGEDGNVIEDTSLLEDSGVPDDGVARRKYFAKNSNLERFFFETEFVYTFDFYSNFFSPARHRLELTPFFSVDLIPYFNGYPLFMSMAREKCSGEYLWATEIWHKRLLNYDVSPGRLSRFFSGTSNSQLEDSSSITDTASESITDDTSDLWDGSER